MTRSMKRLAKIVKGSGSDLCKEKVKGMNGVLGKEISGLLLFYLYLRLESLSLGLHVPYNKKSALSIGSNKPSDR